MKSHARIASAVAVAFMASAVSGMAATTTTPAPKAPPPAVTATAPTTAEGLKAPPSGTIALKDVPDPKNTLARAKIIDLKGNSIGSVGDVMLDKSGKADGLKVDVGGFLGVGVKEVALKADAMKWDPAKKVLVTSMTKDQLNAMPPMKS